MEPTAIQKMEALYIAANFKPTLRNFLPMEELLMHRAEIAKRIIGVRSSGREDIDNQVDLMMEQFVYCNNEIRKVFGIL